MDTSSLSVNISSLPRLLWDLYADYLWNWTDYPNSWVSRIAYTSRVLAILLILPIVVLTLLDIASYGIARTLGVIDTSSASTSDRQTIHDKIPAVQVFEAGTPSPDSAASFVATDSDHETLLDPTDDRLHSSTDTLPPLNIFAPAHPRAYFTSEENSLKLSGVGVFSPAASRPPSPTITRRNLHVEEKTDADSDGIAFRKRVPTMAAQDHADD